MSNLNINGFIDITNSNRHRHLVSCDKCGFTNSYNVNQLSGIAGTGFPKRSEIVAVAGCNNCKSVLYIMVVNRNI